MPATVAVVIPCFNHGRYLAAAIHSALGQGSALGEVIVVDDGSTDDTAEICRRFGNAITYVYQSNAGLSAARNRGALHAVAELLHFLDADDELDPGGLGRLVALTAGAPKASVFLGGWREIDENGLEGDSVSTRQLGNDPFHALFDPLMIGPPCRYMVRRNVFLDAGLFDPRLESCEDWDMWLRLALAGNAFAATRDVVARYRNRPNSMSKNYSRMWESGTRVLSAARRRHGCARCETAYREGVRTWRQYCYLSTLRSDLRLDVRSRNRGEAAMRLARAVSRDPWLVRQATGSVVRNLRRAGSDAP